MADSFGLTPKEKAAVLLISLGKEQSAELYRHLSEEEIGEMTLSIATLRQIDSEARESIVDEFYNMCLANKFLQAGGIDYARALLTQAIGASEADDLIRKLSSSLQVRPFDFIRRADAAQILNVIHNEHPQTIALVLSYIDAKQSAEIVAALPPNRQAEIIRRIANMGSASPDYIREAERVLERKISSMGYTDQIQVGGIGAIVGIINSLDRGSEKGILEILDVEDRILADEIRNNLFVFEDLVKLGGQAVQRVLRDINNQDLAVALKMATDDVKKVIFNNISKRMQEMIVDDMEVMGPVRVRDVEEAQQRIVSVVRKLEDDGEIIIARGEGDDMIV
ncbi:MAG: flagellar motor switch protein FliG [Oscillospiraceae bacterium]|jgi:flagellar motor switch protein FliG|nr:flagellar motor switch protein FliG [Oscillospiraceae bacterium]